MDRMNVEKIQNSLNLKKFFSTFVLLSTFFFLLGCLPENSGKKTTKKSNSTSGTTTTNPTSPNFQNDINFIQNGAEVFNSTVTVNIPFTDSMYLRGKNVDQYIRQSANNQQICLALRIQDTAFSDIVIISARAQSFYNFTTQEREYYYIFSPNDEESNKSFCQKTGLINKLTSLYPTLTHGLRYSLKTMCPTACTKTVYTAKALETYSSSGAVHSSLTTTNLVFKITNIPENNNTTPQSCTVSETCKAQGYDCCSLGQCVRDLEIKSSTNTESLDFLQAKDDILSNPNNIYNYPQFYHICSQPVNTTPDTSTPTDPTAEALMRVEKLKNLYECLNRVEGEMGLCSIEYDAPKVFDTSKTIAQNEALNIGVYSASPDDRSFKDTFTNLNVDKQTNFTIEKITYGGKILYHVETYLNVANTNKATLTNDYVTINPTNNYLFAQENVEAVDDSLTTGTKIILKKLPADSEVFNKKLVITYRTDSSCLAINSSLAKCEKHYIQDQRSEGAATKLLLSRMPITDHYTGSMEKQSFKLPRYADVDKTITVSLDGQNLVRDTDWELVKQNPISSVKLIGLKTASPSQKVKIGYYVDRLNHPNIAQSSIRALSAIQSLCTCQGNECNLKPVYNTSNTIVDYQCVYPQPLAQEPPLNQKIYLSSKAVPVRFFDAATTQYVAEPKTGNIQEGTKFEYTKGDLKKPNNLTSYIGFNEIYGTISTAAGAAKPPREVAVKKGRTYDIYVDQGSFSSCLQCGTDYYSQLNRVFPFSQFGGGVTPMRTISSRVEGNSVRSDDMLFGRACFVPASMIPWSHRPALNVEDQRKNRMGLQHFYFANGYQRDWYGFDYGSIIGSFDGVKWFSIGTKRRIKAEGNKMFIAVNGYFGDQTVESTYNITVLDSSINQYADGLATTDKDSDGAECQRYHQCSTDQDCSATLGYDYVCSGVGEINSLWPVFDDNGNEIADASNDITKLASIFKVSDTATKRCVYRGRGAMCSPSYASLGTNTNNVFNGTVEPAHHVCSANTSCQTILSPSGVANSSFNTRISRYAKTMREVFSDGSEDWFGLRAKLLGRPLNFKGEESIPAQLAGNLSSNKVKALCIPGRNPTSINYESQNVATSLPEYSGDPVQNIGLTVKSTEQSDDQYLNSCSVVGLDKNYFYITQPQTNQTTDTNIRTFAATQNIPTNSLKLIQSVMQSKGVNLDILKSPIAKLQTFSVVENSCLRAPGASCFSDQECAPSKAITDKVKLISSADPTLAALLNSYEIKFWQEELICSQKESKLSAAFDPKNNKCCRDVGKTISVGMSDGVNGINYGSVPGIDVNLNSPTRYSRVSTIYQKVKAGDLKNISYRNTNCETDGTPACYNVSNLENQFLSLDYLASNTSCSESWVRPFASGTRAWNAAAGQKISSAVFKCLNWRPHSTNYSCAGMDVDDPDCKMVQTTPASFKAKEVLKYMEKLELLGIPQIGLEIQATFTGLTEGPLSCLLDPANPGDATYPTSTGGHKAINIFAASNPPLEAQYINTATTPNTHYYAGNKTNYFTSIKKVFKEDEVVSCLPAGTDVALGTDPNKCCTGFINGLTLKCALDDYADISVYTNRYVSSEASKLNANQFDTSTGYVKNLSSVAELACLKNMCASGVMAQGVLISLLKVPGQEDEESAKFRFLQNTSASDNLNGILDLYNLGLKWNNHLYCIPRTLAQQQSEYLAIYDCGQ